MSLAARLNTSGFRRKSGLGFIAGLSALAALVTFQQPLQVYASIDAGLDSGNAVVDRTSVAGQTILKYQTTGTSTFKAPAGVTSVRVLVVGGGGGGGAGESNAGGDAGGGGGAGEYTHVTSQTVVPGQAVTVTVGGGGAGSQTNQADGGTTAQNGASGTNSIFGSLTARGGGGGGGNDQHGLSGGSGGGAGGHCTSGSTNGGTKTAVAPGVGNNGGNSPSGSCSPRGAAGGGGAAAAGTNGSGSNGGVGAAGLQNDITSTNAFYAAGGGGGGGSNTGTGANGGSSIGGKGGNASGGNGVVGTANTGSGGGGGGSVNGTSAGKGANGGSGTVIVRFTTQNIPDAMGMTGVRMWYKADGAGNTNALWKDSSGLGYDMAQGTASKQPVLTTNAINFNPGYVFDATDDAFSMPNHGILGSEGMSAFYAATSTRTDGGYRYFEEFGDDTPSLSMNNGKPDLYVRGTSPIQLTFPTAEALIPHVYSFVSPNANNQPRIVGVDDNEQSQNVTSGTYTTTSGSQSGNTFGSTNGSGGVTWAGPIAEAIYFNRVPTPAERLRVVSYLGIKYGITRYQGASGAGYSDSTGATIWNADATFKNNIAGIGRDDTTTLNQKQSKSSAAGDIVTIGHGTIAASNQANSNTFGADRSFLLWSHNGAATNTTTTVTGAYNRMSRIWKAVRTGTVGQVKIQVPISAVPGGNGILYTSNSTTFDAAATRTTMTVNGSNYEATVTIPTGTSYFSFGSIAGSDIQFMSKSATDLGGSPLTSYTPGEPVEYKLTVKNNGPDNAGTVTVTDTLPTGIVPKVSGSSGGGWNCNVSSQTVTCTRPALNSGVTAPAITIEADIASNITGDKNNTATASVSNDPDTSNNSASLTLPAAPKADLSIAKSHTGIPTAGNNHTYKFTVTNNGPSDVASFTVTDPLNNKMSLVSSSNGVACAPIGLPDGQTVTCTGGALTANGAGSTVAFDMVVAVAADFSGTVSNTGTVAVPAGTTDPTPGNNSSTDQSNVLVDTQVGVVKTHTGNFTAGENNDFTITVDNQGPSTSPIGSITVTDTLDEDFTLVSAVGADWTCSPPGSTTVTCTNNVAMIAGATSDITLTVLVDPIAEGTTSNTAEVSTITPDSDLTDNSFTNPVTIESDADLALTKGHVGSAFVAGQTEQYTFSVTNAGPSADSPSYTITDTLPTDVTFVSTEPGSAAACTGASGNTVVNCTGGAIGVGDPAQVTTINVAVGGSVTGTIDNSATVTVAPGTTDPNLTNNTGDDNNLPIEPNADLSIAKTPNTDMTAGDTESYSITVHNGGPSNIASFTVVDILDSNLTFQASAGCSVTDTLPDSRQEVTCTGGAVNNGADAPVITINVLVESTVTPGSTIGNTATVEPPAGVNDPTPGNNSSSANRSVVASADLEITKSHTGNFTAGTNNNTYTIEVTNNGPSDATTFTVTDVLPTGLTFVSGTSTAGVNASCINASQTVTCTGGPTISTGQSSTITLTVAANADIAGNTTLDNTASVASATPDPNNANNTSPTDTVTIDSKADLEVTKSNGSDFTAGSDEDYTIGVVNHGPSDVSGFTVTDTLPAELTFVSVGSDPACSAIAQAVTCNGSALASGANTSFTVRVHTDSGLTAGTVINNTANVATIAPTTDPNAGNNSATDPTTVVNITDLSIQKGHTGTFVAGQTGQYTFTVSNAGPSAAPASDVQVSDTLPEGMTFASEIGTGWDCTGSTGRNVTCTYAPSLAVSSTTPTLTVTVNIAPDKQGEVTNTGTVISTLDDSDPPDDTDSDTTTIVAQADLTATKTAQGAGPFVAGQSITYRFEVENNGGPSLANNVTITDNLQGDFTYQSFADVSGGTWGCSESGGTVTCTLSSLAVGATAIVDITLKIAEDAPNPLVNSAITTFDGTVENPGDANPSTSTPLSYSADLEVDITHEQKTYHAGDTVDYTITAINHGPSAAEDAVLTVTIPEGLTIEHVSAEKPGGGSILGAIDRFFFPRALAATNPFTCSLNGNKLICNASTMFVGSYPLYVTGKISNNFTGQLVLAAHITSSTPDPNLSDTTASDTIFGVLAATGQNIWLWIGGAGIMLAAGGILVFRMRYQNRAI